MAGSHLTKGRQQNVQQIFQRKPNGRQPLGRQRLRSEDQEQKNLKKLGADTELVAEDKKVWKRIVVEAKNHLGFGWPQK